MTIDQAQGQEADMIVIDGAFQHRDQMGTLLPQSIYTNHSYCCDG